MNRWHGVFSIKEFQFSLPCVVKSFGDFFQALKRYLTYLIKLEITSVFKSLIRMSKSMQQFLLSPKDDVVYFIAYF